MNRFGLTVALVVVTAIAISVVASEEGKKFGRRNRTEAAAAETSKDSKDSKDKQKDKDDDRWMHMKLDAAQEIFAHLTHGDLEAVKKRARGMLVINILENWMKRNEFTKKSAYQGQLNAFEFANKEIIRNAEDGDIDGTLDAWVKLSRSCVECHKLIRDGK